MPACRRQELRTCLPAGRLRIKNKTPDRTCTIGRLGFLLPYPS